MNDFTSGSVNPLATNNEPSLCSVCCQDLPIGLAVLLRKCRHPFCFPCLKDALFNGTKEHIECPYPFRQFECGSKLEDDEVAYILEYDEVYNFDQWQAKTDSMESLFEYEVLTSDGSSEEASGVAEKTLNESIGIEQNSAENNQEYDEFGLVSLFEIVQPSHLIDPNDVRADSAQNETDAYSNGTIPQIATNFEGELKEGSSKNSAGRIIKNDPNVQSLLSVCSDFPSLDLVDLQGSPIAAHEVLGKTKTAAYSSGAIPKISTNSEEESSVENSAARTINIDDSNHDDKSPLETNDGQSKCSACCQDLSSGLTFILRTCQHPFCFACLKRALLNDETDDIECPYSYKQFKCRAKLAKEEVTYILKHTDASKGTGSATNPGTGSSQKVAEESLEFWLAWINLGLNELFKVLQQTEPTSQDTATNETSTGAIPKFPSRNIFECSLGRSVNQTEPVSATRNSEGAFAEVTSSARVSFLRRIIDFKSVLLEDSAKDGSDMAGHLPPDRRTFHCSVCNGTPKTKEEVTLHCSHNFCKRCLAETVKHTDDVDVKCPAMLDGTSKCTAILLENEIRMFLSNDEYNKYLDKCVQKAEGKSPNNVHCLKPKCPGWIEVDGYVDSFNCPVCATKNCVFCKAIHTGQTCKNYQDTLNPKKGGNNTDNLPDRSEVDPPSSHEDPKCSACNGASQADEELMLSECLHLFCKPCLAETVKHAEDVVVQCPALLNGVTECPGTLLEHEIRALLSKEEYHKYQEKCIRKAEAEIPNSVHCLKRNCPGWIVVEGYVDSFECYVCSSRNCLSCKAIHTGQTCKIYQDTQMPNSGTSNAHNLEVISDTILPPNHEAFECPICNEIFQPYTEVMLSECFHMFCKTCLIQTVKHAEDAVVECPALLDGARKCTAILYDNEIRVLLSDVDYNKYLQKSLQKAEAMIANTVHCLKPNCPGWIEAVGNLESFDCSVCSTKNCIPCKAIHAGQTCKDYKATLERTEEELLSEEKMKTMVETRESMRCPGCGVMLMKNEGCDFIRCTQCKTEICWPTRGRRWGPGGPGDNSGGCGCRLDKRCHPECDGCHVWLE